MNRKHAQTCRIEMRNCPLIMIHLTGSTQRSFIFPADQATALAYYSDINRICPFLSHISVVRNYDPGQYRLLYSTVEMGFYQIRIFCDIRMTLDMRGHRLLINPLEGIPPVRTITSLYSIDCQGLYSSESIFGADGDQTRCRLQHQPSGQVPCADCDPDHARASANQHGSKHHAMAHRRNRRGFY